jgi:hypothetical protein
MPTTYISNLAHYTHVLEKVRTVQRVLWIGTADLKDVYMMGKRAKICLSPLYPSCVRTSLSSLSPKKNHPVL